jgi:hypothetical protein
MIKKTIVVTFLTALFLTVLQSPSEARYRRHHARHSTAVDANGSRVIGGRPEGCPRAYCGCGLRKYLGIADASLDLAWNWAKKFPRTIARAGAAAVRSHHVMLLESHVAGSLWNVRDYNGGRHLSYIHVRDVRGFIFVDPRARIASAAP